MNLMNYLTHKCTRTRMESKSPFTPTTIIFTRRRRVIDGRIKLENLNKTDGKSFVCFAYENKCG